MKPLSLILILLITVCQDCYSQRPHKFIDETIEVESNNVPLDSSQHYFPSTLFPVVQMVWKVNKKSNVTVTPKIHQNKIDSMSLDWFSQHLYAMKEPLLFNKQLPKSIYRFTWLRTFNNPVIVRIEKDTSGILLYWKMTDGMGGYEPGAIVVDEKRRITQAEWENFLSKIETADFWQMERSGIYGEDGSMWILEGVEPTKYHATSVWHPARNGDFYQVGNYLLELTGLKIKKEEKY